MIESAPMLSTGDHILLIPRQSHLWLIGRLINWFRWRHAKKRAYVVVDIEEEGTLVVARAER